MSKPGTRKNPNILITGTPGTGKTTVAKVVAQKLGFKYCNVSELAVEHEFIDSYDDELDSFNLDEDKVLDYLESSLGSFEGGVIVDYHSCEMFPERWFDGVFVLRCDNTVLFDRLTGRGYNDKKKTENIECEIFSSILEEAHESYPENLVFELENRIPEQLDENVSYIVNWAKKLIMQ